MADVEVQFNADTAALPQHLERLINAYTKAVIGEAIEAGHALTDGFQLTVSADSDVVLDKIKNRHWVGFKMRGIHTGRRQWEAWRGSLWTAEECRGRTWPSLLDAVYCFIEKPEWAAGQLAQIDGSTPNSGSGSSNLGEAT
jgi:hypothetical protein